MSNNITFLLPIKDRIEFTKRFLSSFDYSYNVPIIISDGSFTASDELTEIINTKSNVLYKKFDFDKDYLTFLTKLKNSINLVDTNYVALVCDDDFYFLDQINEAVKFLENNLEYSMYKTSVKNFTISSGINNYFNYGVYGNLILTNDNYESYNEQITDDNVLERFKRLQDCYPYEGVFKTSILKKALEIAVSVNCFHHNIFIDILRYVIFINGKVYFKKKYILARQNNTPTSAGETHLKSFDKIEMKSSKLYFDIYQKISEKLEKLFNEFSYNYEFKFLKDQIFNNLNDEIEELRKNKSNKFELRLQNKFIKSLLNTLLKKDDIVINKYNVLDAVNSINKKINKNE